jgi:formate hydrogenlyase subunit 4
MLCILAALILMIPRALPQAFAANFTGALGTIVGQAAGAIVLALIVVLVRKIAKRTRISWAQAFFWGDLVHFLVLNRRLY